MTTLPQSKLTQANLNWVVVAGDSKQILGAFQHAADAAAFALVANGGHKVGVGHTVFGWYDWFDRDATGHANATDMDAWAAPFYQDDWHNARYQAALLTGEVA